MVLFGAPQAHEDDPLRAVMAALELQEIFNGSLRFGINTGYVFAGDLGTAERREYTVMGDEVNLAHRLMSKCQPGEIWLGPNTYQHAAVRYRVTARPGCPYRVQGEEWTDRALPSFVGCGVRCWGLRLPISRL
jgi:adenylate cyclase